MTWPTAATKVHMDAGTDDPKQARSELADLVDQFNTLRSHVSSLSQTLLALTSAGDWRSNLAAQQAINALTAEAAPAVGDYFGIRDSSAGADRKVLLSDLLKIINGLTQDNSPDGAADYVATYDASAGTAKKVLLNDLAGVFTEDSGESGEQSITSGGSFSFSHGLSGKPHLVQVWLRCKTAEAGYSVGNEVWMNPATLDGNDKGLSLRFNVSTVDGIFGADPAVFNILNWSTKNRTNLTNGNWRLVMRAWR